MTFCTTALQNRRILIVEDDYLIAQIVTDFLEDAGATIIAQISSVDEAVAYIQEHSATIDCAVVDLNLHGKRSYPVADALTDKGITFIFATGYGGGALDMPYGNHPRCEKPFTQDRLIAALAALNG